MSASGAVLLAAAIAAALYAAYLFWRHVWFTRTSSRNPPDAPGVVSPADGTVVYVRHVAPGEDVVVVKRGAGVSLGDIVREDIALPKLVIGIFMSPFDVHYNRIPLSGRVEFVRHYPARTNNRHMLRMYLRVLLGRAPLFRGSAHIGDNERAVTRIRARYRDAELDYYVVQIGARGVAGISTYLAPGDAVERGSVFGIVRIGSQVDLVLPWREDLEVCVTPGQRVRAGETILVR